jgi:hypothetical protein
MQVLNDVDNSRRELPGGIVVGLDVNRAARRPATEFRFQDAAKLLK